MKTPLLTGVHPGCGHPLAYSFAEHRWTDPTGEPHACPPVAKPRAPRVARATPHKSPLKQARPHATFEGRCGACKRPAVPVRVVDLPNGGARWLCVGCLPLEVPA